jgi:hypothetical protein
VPAPVQIVMSKSNSDRVEDHHVGSVVMFKK